MIVKFLYTKQPNGSFPAVSYNTEKMDRDKGELMKVANFGPLQGLGHLRPQDYKNYLQMISARSKAVIKPQFHVAISAAGKTYDKHQLTAIASQWIERMGYGKQPYLIVYHHDTNNNHVHIVSTRVTREGKKIRDNFEQIKGLEQMNLIMGKDARHNAAAEITNALAYHFSSQAQFLMILESRGYVLKEEAGQLQVIKFGKQQGEVLLSAIQKKIHKEGIDRARQAQLKAIFNKYAVSYATRLVNRHGRYQSDFSCFLKTKFDIDLLFHASADKPPYGYSIVDHSKQQVFKGSDIMPLRELLAIDIHPTSPRAKVSENRDVLKDNGYYAAVLKAAIYNYPDMLEGLAQSNLAIKQQEKDFILVDLHEDFAADTKDLLNERDYNRMINNLTDSIAVSGESKRYLAPIAISIADDVDDQQVLGMKRRRKKMARTNTR